MTTYPKKLQCSLDNPLCPTLVTLNLPPLKFSDSGLPQVTFSEQISIEISKEEHTETHHPKGLAIHLSNSPNDDLFMNLCDENLGLDFSLLFDKEGRVKKVSAAWA